MGLPGVTDQTVYRGLKDVLTRQPEITAVQFSKTVPTQILWTVVERLFDTKIPTLTGEH